MALPKALIDTDILSAIMRKNVAVLPSAREYLAAHGRLTISLITRYEVLRGLRAKDAHAQARSFDAFCAHNEVVGLSEDIVSAAADIYADLFKRGALVGDADVLIAATARVAGLTVVTNNERHFSRIPGLQLANWLSLG
jgi:tRNA(fMet)-specific endonuclease VapC